MKQFSKADKTEHAEIVTRLHRAKTALEHAIEEYNHQMALKFEIVSTALSGLQGAVEDATTFLDGMRETAQTYFDDRSEKWQEGEAGEAYQAWINELEVSLDEIEIEQPEALDEPDMDAIELFEHIPQEVEG